MTPSIRRAGAFAVAVTMLLVGASCGSDDDAIDAPAATDDAPAGTSDDATGDDPTGEDETGEDEPDTGTSDTGTSDTGTSDTGTSDTGEPETATSDTGTSDHSVSIPEAVGPADDSLDPVVVGVINMDEGTPSYPDVSTGIEAAAALVNAELGGIHGRPIEIRRCNVGVDQASNQQCAQEFANDQTVGVVINGYVFGSGFTLPILEAAGLPTLLQTPLTQSDFMAEYAWGFQGGNAGGTAGTAAYAATFLDAEEIVIIGANNDALRAAVQTIEGIPAVEGVNISTTYVSETAADITADVQSSGALGADAVLALVNAPQCLQLAQTLVDIGATAPIISTATCAVPSTLEANADVFAGWTIVGSGLPPLLHDGESAELDYYLDRYAEYGDAAHARSFQTLGGFGALLAVHRIGNDLPEEPSRDDWADGLEGFTGPYFGGRVELSCPGPHFPAVCDNEVRAFELDDEGRMTLVQDFFDGLS